MHIRHCLPFLPITTLLLMLLPVAAATSTMADEYNFMGSWVIAKAVVAPWADPGTKPNNAEMKSLIGKTVTFKKGLIAGPGILACSGPIYDLNDGGPEMLFQGALTQKADGSEQDPTAPAARLGFHGSTIKTLQTGCENEIDYDFVDAETLEFGLNDYVYTMTRKGN